MIAPELLAELRELSVDPDKCVGDTDLVLISQTRLHQIVRVLEARPLSQPGQMAAMRRFDETLTKLDKALARKTQGISAMHAAVAGLRKSILGVEP